MAANKIVFFKGAAKKYIQTLLTFYLATHLLYKNVEVAQCFSCNYSIIPLAACTSLLDGTFTYTVLCEKSMFFMIHCWRSQSEITYVDIFYRLFKKWDYAVKDIKKYCRTYSSCVNQQFSCEPFVYLSMMVFFFKKSSLFNTSQERKIGITMFRKSLCCASPWSPTTPLVTSVTVFIVLLYVLRIHIFE